MKGSQIGLKLFLDDLGIPSDISNISGRKTIQKAVYIGQESGADIGYSHGWYLMGPYSPELTHDYYILSSDIALGDEEYKNYKLPDSYSGKLRNLKGLMNPPKEVELSQEDWLELVASILYCKNEHHYDKAQTKNFLTQEKNNLIKYFDEGVEALKLYKLIE